MKILIQTPSQDTFDIITQLVKNIGENIQVYWANTESEVDEQTSVSSFDFLIKDLKE